MTYWQEEEGPCIHHRSLFDTEPPPAVRCAPTEPCPPSFACDDAAPVALVTRKEPDSDGFNPAACHGVSAIGHDGNVIPPGENHFADFHRRLAVQVLEDPTFHLSALGRKSLAEHGVALPATLTFEGGDVAVEKPTREALVLSARQWATAVREHLLDNAGDDGVDTVACAKLDRLDAVLAELAAL